MHVNLHESHFWRRCANHQHVKTLSVDFAPRSCLHPENLAACADYIAVIGSNRQRPFLKRVKRAMLGSVPLDVVSAAVPAFVQGVDFSDHRNFWLHGYNAVMITDTAFLRNTAYHTPQDT